MADPWEVHDEPTVFVNGVEKSYTPNGDTVRELVRRVVADHDFRTADVKVDGNEVNQNSDIATSPASGFDTIEISKHTTVGAE